MAQRPGNNNQAGGSEVLMVALAARLFERRVGPPARLEKTPEAIADDCLGLAETFYRRAEARQTEAPRTERTA